MCTISGKRVEARDLTRCCAEEACMKQAVTPGELERLIYMGSGMWFVPSGCACKRQCAVISFVMTLFSRLAAQFTAWSSMGFVASHYVMVQLTLTQQKMKERKSFADQDVY